VLPQKAAEAQRQLLELIEAERRAKTIASAVAGRAGGARSASA